MNREKHNNKPGISITFPGGFFNITYTSPAPPIDIIIDGPNKVIANILDVNNVSVQEQALEANDHTLRSERASPKASKKSPIENTTINLPGTSSTSNSSKIINKNKTTAMKLQTSPRVETSEGRDDKIMKEINITKKSLRSSYVEELKTMKKTATKEDKNSANEKKNNNVQLKNNLESCKKKSRSTIKTQLISQYIKNLEREAWEENRIQNDLERQRDNIKED